MFQVSGVPIKPWIFKFNIICCRSILKYWGI